MSIDEKLLHDAVREVIEKNGYTPLPDAVIELIVGVASDCYDLGYKAAKREAELPRDK
jgi:hypothetical protein